MNLDSEYLRGSMMKYTCSRNTFFHCITAEFDSTSPRVLTKLVWFTFSSLSFKVYIFREHRVINLISSICMYSSWKPIDLRKEVPRWHSWPLVVNDILKFWNIKLSGSQVIGAPEYCHVNFTKYFTYGFWSDLVLTSVFGSRKPHYFSNRVMVMDLVRWIKGHYKVKKIENWMRI